jgi:predicted alpha/beta-hydrolase family hydrolase
MRTYPATPGAPVFVLAHGAGAGEAHPWMQRTAHGLVARGVMVVTFDFPYKAEGRKLPDPGTVLEAAFATVWRDVVRESKGARMFAGGKSMGGRISSQLAARGGFDPAPSGLVFFGYPLHPPGKPAQRRDRHLPAIEIPMLFLHGERDGFGSPDEMTALVGGLRHAELDLVAGGDHSLIAPKRQDPDGAAFERVLDRAATWIVATATRHRH